MDARETYPGERQDLSETVGEIRDRLARGNAAKHPVFQILEEALSIGGLVELRVAMGAWDALPGREKRRLLGTASLDGER